MRHFWDLEIQTAQPTFFGQVVRFHVYKAHIKFEIDLENWAGQIGRVYGGLYLKAPKIQISDFD